MTISRICNFSVPSVYRIALAIVLAFGLGSLGCAGAAANAPRAPFDVRSSSVVTDTEPRVLIQGRVRLLHVDVDHNRDVTLLLVLHRQGSPIDCGQLAAPIDAARLFRSGTERLDMYVMADEAVCFAIKSASHASRGVRVSWHARGEEEPDLVSSLEIATPL